MLILHNFREIAIREYMYVRKLRQKFESGQGLNSVLMPVLLFSRSLKIGVNFAFVLTPKSAVKSSSQNWRTYILYYFKFSGLSETAATTRRGGCVGLRQS